jgi:ketose-bisphosphate aldolase
MKYEMMKAMKGGYAVPAFNFFSFDNLVGIAKGAAEKKSPVIAMATTSGIKVMGEKAVVRMAEGIADDWGIDMVLHLDHCTDIELLKRCVDNGFTSVMIDSSKKDFEENKADTARVVEYAARYGVTVESELGHVGGKEDDIVVDDMSVMFTQPEKAVEFVQATGIDALAVAVGTVHGFYKATPKLDFPRISRIHELLPATPLVLHGGTGVPYDDFREAIRRGVRKINVGTELKVHGVFDTSVAGYNDPASKSDPRAVSKLVIAKVSSIVEEIIGVMGSEGKAD